MNFQTLESDVRRAWAAVRFLDAPTRRAVETPLQLTATGVRWVRNRSGLHVAMEIREEVLPAAERPADWTRLLCDHENAFDPVPAVPAFQVTARVGDPAGRYLPRLFALRLPRASVPPGPAAERFVALEVTLDPSPTASMRGTWAALRLSVRHDGRPASHAAIRLQRRGGGAPLGRGMSDERGEALVVAAGIAQVTVGDGALVVENEIEADAVVSFDPAADPQQPVDPDALALRAGVVRRTIPLALASGRVQALAIELP